MAIFGSNRVRVSEVGSDGISGTFSDIGIEIQPYTLHELTDRLNKYAKSNKINPKSENKIENLRRHSENLMLEFLNGSEELWGDHIAEYKEIIETNKDKFPSAESDLKIGLKLTGRDVKLQFEEFKTITEAEKEKERQEEKFRKQQELKENIKTATDVGASGLSAADEQIEKFQEAELEREKERERTVDNAVKTGAAAIDASEKYIHKSQIEAELRNKFQDEKDRITQQTENLFEVYENALNKNLEDIQGEISKAFDKAVETLENNGFPKEDIIANRKENLLNETLANFSVSTKISAKDEKSIIVYSSERGFTIGSKDEYTLFKNDDTASVTPESYDNKIIEKNGIYNGDLHLLNSHNGVINRRELLENYVSTNNVYLIEPYGKGFEVNTTGNVYVTDIDKKPNEEIKLSAKNIILSNSDNYNFFLRASDGNEFIASDTVSFQSKGSIYLSSSIRSENLIAISNELLVLDSDLSLVTNNLYASAESFNIENNQSLESFGFKGEQLEAAKVDCSNIMLDADRCKGDITTGNSFCKKRFSNIKVTMKAHGMDGEVSYESFEEMKDKFKPAKALLEDHTDTQQLGDGLAQGKA